MSRARHGKKSHGGSVKAVEAGGNPKVFAEAKARKSGGKVVACGPDGAMAKKRMDRPARASGGRVGSDKSPLSSAHKSS
jgi:hypothetical protein